MSRKEKRNISWIKEKIKNHYILVHKIMGGKKLPKTCSLTTKDTSINPTTKTFPAQAKMPWSSLAAYLSPTHTHNIINWD